MLLPFSATIALIRSFNELRPDVQNCVTRLHFATVERGNLDVESLQKTCNAFGKETVKLAAEWIMNFTNGNDPAHVAAVEAMRKFFHRS